MDTFLRYEIAAIVGGFALVVAFQLVTGQINLRNMLAEKDGSGRYSPIRVQLLVLTLAGLGYYVLKLFDSTDAGGAITLPRLPAGLVAVLGGSNLVYLSGKYYALLMRRIR